MRRTLTPESALNITTYLILQLADLFQQWTVIQNQVSSFRSRVTRAFAQLEGCLLRGSVSQVSYVTHEPPISYLYERKHLKHQYLRETIT